MVSQQHIHITKKRTVPWHECRTVPHPTMSVSGNASVQTVPQEQKDVTVSPAISHFLFAHPLTILCSNKHGKRIVADHPLLVIHSKVLLTKPDTSVHEILHILLVSQMLCFPDYHFPLHFIFQLIWIQLILVFCQKKLLGFSVALYLSLFLL